MNKIILIFIAILLIIAGLVSGYFLGKSTGYEFGYSQGQANKEAYYKEKIENIYPSMPEPEEIYSYNGKITKIEGDTIFLEVRSQANPLADQIIESKIVRTDENTELFKRVMKTPEEIEKEMKDITKPPTLDKEIKSSFSDLNEGDMIIAFSEENIKGNEEFKASKVINLKNMF